ncbi:MAG TPA: hemolysin family protein [Thermodesulfobacteriota bacterium]|jgi:CBS domain containing-hemolysin-like protein
MFWKLLFVLFLVLANGFFVAAEFALVKLRVQEIKLLARQGSKTAALVEQIVTNLDAYLSACQLGITLASLGLGWVGEPLVARTIEPAFNILGIPEDRVHFVAFPLAFIIITLLHITVGEQVPKILAIKKHKATALVISMPLAIFYKIFKPFIWVLNTLSNWMLRLIGIQIDSEHGEVHTEDEVRAILLESAAVGHLTLSERLIMENVLDLENKIARRYMLPRNQIVYLDINDSLEENLHIASESEYTRLPLCDGDLDHVIGIVHVKDIFKALANKEDIKSLVDIARKPTFLPETVILDVLLREFQKKHTALALLVDEHGVVSGMITLEDVLEELVGPIQDEFDSETPTIVKKGTDTFEVDAASTIDEIEKKLGIELSDSDADTIGGVLIERFGYIPTANENITLGQHEITILEAEPTRIRRVLIRRLKPEEIAEVAVEEKAK